MSSEIRVGDIMTKTIVIVPIGGKVVDAARLMKKHGIGSVVVVESKGSKVAKGIITERDIVHKLVANSKDLSAVKVEAIMSKPLRVVTPETTIEKAAQAMKENKIKRLPVINGKHELVGIVSEGDIMRIFPAVVDLLEERVSLR